MVMFQKTKPLASPFLPFSPNDRFGAGFYNRNMSTKPQNDWHLKDWLKALAVKQSKLLELTDWDKRKTSELVNGKQRYNRDIINEAAWALNLQPYELLMHPADAMEIRNLRNSISLAAERRAIYHFEPDDLSDLSSTRKQQ